MAQEGGSSEASVASSSPPAASWWETITTNSSIMSSSSSWNAAMHVINHGRWAQGQNQLPHAASNSCEGVSISTNSFTNPSNHSTETHLWNQVLLGSSVGNSEGMEQISSQKNLIRSRLMFDPACDYLKKLDGGWELTSNSSADLSALEKQLIREGYINSAGEAGDHMAGDHNSERLIITTNLTDLVSNWSIAPPNYPQHQQQQQHLHNNNNNNNNNNNGRMNPNSASSDMSSPQYTKHEEAIPVGGSSTNNSFPPQPPPAFHSYADHDNDALDHALQQNENGGFASTFATGLANQIGPVIGLENRGLMADAPCWSINSVPRNLSVDLISFSPLLNKQPAALMELSGPSCQGNKKAGHHHLPSSSSSSSSYRKGGGRDPSGTAAPSQEKKKTATHHHYCTSDNTPFKKPKHHHTSTISSPHIIKSVQAPKVKVGDKITALQQIVSPFGKTDTASVLLEAIKYIRFLQEQVQLLSDPYLKSNANKDQMSSWPGSMERKEKADPKHDLRGRGLCLVPISCTPQAYRENSGPDYWTPPFRGCLYR